MRIVPYALASKKSFATHSLADRSIMYDDTHDDDSEVPLPATLLFVLTMAAAFLAGWFILFLLMKARV